MHSPLQPTHLDKFFIPGVYDNTSKSSYPPPSPLQPTHLDNFSIPGIHDNKSKSSTSTYSYHLDDYTISPTTDPYSESYLPHPSALKPPAPKVRNLTPSVPLPTNTYHAYSSTSSINDPSPYNTNLDIPKPQINSQNTSGESNIEKTQHQHHQDQPLPSNISIVSALSMDGSVYSGYDEKYDISRYSSQQTVTAPRPRSPPAPMTLPAPVTHTDTKKVSGKGMKSWRWRFKPDEVFKRRMIYVAWWLLFVIALIAVVVFSVLGMRGV